MPPATRGGGGEPRRCRARARRPGRHRSGPRLHPRPRRPLRCRRERSLHEELSMTDPTHDDTSNASSAEEAASDLDWPMLVLPPEQLTDRELIARAEYCDQIARTGSPADQAAALRDLDAARDEAETRAAGQPADSVPAQVAGYIGLVRED